MLMIMIDAPRSHQNSSSASPPFFFLPPLLWDKTCRSYISAICSGPVPSSTPLSSRIRKKRGNLNEIPLSSTCVIESVKHPRIQMKSTYQSLCCGVNWTETQVGSQNLPENFGLKPHIRLRATNLDITTNFGKFKWIQGVVVCLQHFLAESSSNFANGLKLFGISVIAREEERAVDVCAFAFAVVATYYNQIQRVPDASQIVFFELEKS